MPDPIPGLGTQEAKTLHETYDLLEDCKVQQVNKQQTALLSPHLSDEEEED